MVALYAVWYNFIRVHRRLKMSPAMASMDDLYEKMEAVAPKPGKRGPYKESVAEISN